MMLRRFLERLFRPAAPAPPQADESYRQWWDANATDMAAAVRSTVPTPDEEDYRARGWHGDANSFGAKQFIERAALTPQSRVLEIGCGIARIGREMAPRVGEWHGADISPNMIRLAGERCGVLPNVRFHLLRPPDLLRALPQDHFDFVYATIVLMHLDKEDVFRYLCDAFRLVRVGGMAYFDTWNIDHPDVFRIWHEASPPGEPKVRGRLQCSSVPELRMFLRQAGFEIESLDEGEQLVRAFCRRTGEEPPPITDDGFPPFGYLVRPHNMEVVSGVVTLDGLALDRIAKVEVWVDGGPVGPVRYGEPRTDVPPALPRYVDCARCGFAVELDTTRLTDGPHEVRVVATDRDGRATCLTGQHQGILVRNSAAG